MKLWAERVLAVNQAVTNEGDRSTSACQMHLAPVISLEFGHRAREWNCVYNGFRCVGDPAIAPASSCVTGVLTMIDVIPALAADAEVAEAADLSAPKLPGSSGERSTRTRVVRASRPVHDLEDILCGRPRDAYPE